MAGISKIDPDVGGSEVPKIKLKINVVQPLTCCTPNEVFGVGRAPQETDGNRLLRPTVFDS
jgi:hypothetical protein